MDEQEPRPLIQVEAGFEETWPGAEALATECVLNLTFLSDRLMDYTQALARTHGIPTVAGFNVLTIVHGAGEPLPPSTIADRMIVTRPTMTGILGSLERRGLIRRLPHPEDRRMVLIDITPEGRARVERLLPELHRVEKDLMGCLTLPERRALLSTVAKLQAYVARQPLPDGREAADPGE